MLRKGSWIVVVALFGLLLGCQPRARELRHIRLPMGYVANVQFAPIYVAVERGYFVEEGLEIEFDYSWETDGVRLVAAGELPFSIASGDQVILARAQGLPIVYVGAWWQRYPVGISVLQGSGIETPEDLAGRSIATPVTYGASYIGWRALGHAVGLDDSDVNLMVVGYAQVAVLSQGQADAAVVYANNEPVQLEAAGFPVTTFRVSDYAELVSNGVVTGEDVIAQEPELVRGFVRAMLRGVSDTLEDPDAAFEISKQYVEGLEDHAEVQRAVLEETLYFWQAQRLGETSDAAWESMQEVMLEAGLVDVRQPVESFYSNEFLP